MSATIELRVLELLCSRLCHELISPVTAVNNGMELFADSPSDMMADIVSLVSASGGQASRKLQFYRIAYGFGGDGAAAPSVTEAGRLVQGLLEGGKVEVAWPGPGPVGDLRLGREPVKLLLNVALIGAEALPRGGRLEVTIAAGSPATLRVAARGENARLNPESAAALADSASIDHLTPRSVHGFFTRRLADAMGGTMTVEEPAPGAVVITATAPMSV
ncbi:MAG: histidine phosphotransferase family protein [Rhodospirillales bacterium]